MNNVNKLEGRRESQDIMLKPEDEIRCQLSNGTRKERPRPRRLS